MSATARLRGPGPEAATAGDAVDGVLLAPSREPTRLLEALLGTVVLFAWVPPGVPSFLAVGFVASGLLVLLGATRRPVRRLTDRTFGLRWLAVATVVVGLSVVAVTVATPDGSLYGWEKRALRLVLVLALLVVVVQGRLHLPSLVRGMAAGLVANAVLFFAGLAPAPYGASLSGFLLDKNQAGLTYSVVGLLYAGLQDRPWRRNAVVAVTAALVWTTGSRTSLAAIACGTAWLLVGGRLGRVGRAALALALAAFVEIAETSYARVGIFADRYGTDFLRSRIDAASRAKLDLTPPWGSGLGEAFIFLQDKVFLFHNSYWAALLEGGWPLVGLYVVATTLVAVGVLRRGPGPTPWVGAEAANVAVLVCALRLGEVFGATTAMLALAAGIIGHMALRAAARGDPGAAPPSGAP